VSSPKRPAERIQKALANAGYGSRRQMEIWIAAGRVTVNGKRAQLGDLFTGRERVCIDGKPVHLSEEPASRSVSFALYYEPGDEQPRGRVARGDELAGIPPAPKHGRWLDVASLAPNSSGLVLLTTDGQLKNRLTHPSTRIEREYAVRLLGEPRQDQIDKLLRGVELEEEPAKLERFEPRGGGGSNVWYRAVLRDTRSRLLRPLLNVVGITVSRMIRLRYGPLELGKLRRGMSRALTLAEVTALYEAAGLPVPELKPLRPAAASKPSRPRMASGRHAHQATRARGAPPRSRGRHRQ
jgi:23S rRNA pseudouridine2605 synthase